MKKEPRPPKEVRILDLRGITQSWDQILTFASVEEMTEQLKAASIPIDTWNNPITRTPADLFRQIAEKECRVVRKGKNLCRLVKAVGLDLLYPTTPTFTHWLRERVQIVNGSETTRDACHTLDNKIREDVDGMDEVRAVAMCFSEKLNFKCSAVVLTSLDPEEMVDAALRRAIETHKKHDAKLVMFKVRSYGKLDPSTRTFPGLPSYRDIQWYVGVMPKPDYDSQGYKVTRVISDQTQPKSKAPRKKAVFEWERYTCFPVR